MESNDEDATNKDEERLVKGREVFKHFDYMTNLKNASLVYKMIEEGFDVEAIINRVRYHDYVPRKKAKKKIYRNHRYKDPRK
jgi:hypothetical protein